MKNLICSSLLAVLLLCSAPIWAQAPSNWDPFYRYLSTKTSYPGEARLNLLQGDNIITFSLEKGTVKSVNVQTQLATSTDIGVVNLILAYPGFKTAKNGNYAIRTAFRLQGANTAILNEDAKMPTGFTALSTINVHGIAPAIAGDAVQGPVKLSGSASGIFFRGKMA